MIYDITPVPAPRMTRSDKWRKRPCVLRYFDFRDKVEELGITVDNGDLITFTLAMPKSWSKKKTLAMDGQPHTQRPDIDNMLKALLDSIYDEDAHIHTIGRLHKKWGVAGSIEVTGG